MNISQFIKQKSYEHIVYVLRRHPITFFPIAFLFIILLFIPLIVYGMIVDIYPDMIISNQVLPLIVLGGSAYYLSIYLFFYAQFIDYYLDIWIITNDRVIDTEQHGLFHRTITEFDLYQIQDVTSQIKGVFPTVFQYGDLTIKTASSTTTIIFHNIPNPNKIREHIIRLADGDRKYHMTQTSPQT